MTRERNESGQYVETVGLADVLAVFEQVRGPVITSSDVSDALDCTTEAARQKLTRLYDRGLVDWRKTGRTKVYWRVDGTDTPENARERRETPVADTADRTDTSPDATHETGDTRATVDEVLDGLAAAPDRREAVRACLAHLREHGTAQKSDFVDAVYSDHPAGYKSPGGWWNKVGKEYLRAAVEDLDGFTPPAGEGSHTWRYSGEQDPVEDSTVYDPTDEW